MFKTAIKWRWLVENPAREIEAPPTRVKRLQRALSVEEVSLLFEHLANPARLIMMIGVTMGLRIGETLGLRVDDFDCGTLHVRRSWCRGHAGATKNGKDREVPVPPFLGEALRDYRAQRPKTGWLFPGESGKPLSDRNLIQRHVYPVAQRLGIPHFSWHSLSYVASLIML